MDKKIIQKIGIIGDGLTGKLTTIALFRLGYPVEIIGKKVQNLLHLLPQFQFLMIVSNFLKNLRLII